MLSNITSCVNIFATLLNSTFICSHNMNKLFCRRHGKWKKGLSWEEHGGNGRNVTRQKVTLKVWTQRVLRFHFFGLIVVNSRQLFACLWRKLFHCCYKECMGKQPCLFMCYWKQELHEAMDGGGSDYIEERFA